MDIKKLMIIDSSTLETSRDKLKNYPELKFNNKDKIKKVNIENEYIGTTEALIFNYNYCNITVHKLRDYPHDINSKYYTASAWVYIDPKYNNTSYDNGMSRVFITPFFSIGVNNGRTNTCYFADVSQWNDSSKYIREVSSHVKFNEWNNFTICRNNDKLFMFVNGVKSYEREKTLEAPTIPPGIIGSYNCLMGTMESSYHAGFPIAANIFIPDDCIYTDNFDYKNSIINDIYKGTAYSKLFSSNGDIYSINHNGIYNFGKSDTMDINEVSKYSSKYMNKELPKGNIIHFPETDDDGNYSVKLSSKKFDSLKISNNYNTMYLDGSTPVNLFDELSRDGGVKHIDKDGRKCMEFYGSNSSYTIINKNMYDFRDKDFTIAFRILFESNNTRGVLCNNNSSINPFCIGINEGVDSRVFVNMKTFYNYKSNILTINEVFNDSSESGYSYNYNNNKDALLIMNKWNTMVYTKKGKYMHIYLNNKKIAEYLYIDFYPLYDDGFRIGVSHHHPGSTWYNYPLYITDFSFINGLSVPEDDILNFDNIKNYSTKKPIHYIESTSGYYIPLKKNLMYCIDFSKDVPEDLYTIIGESSIIDEDGVKVLDKKSGSGVMLNNTASAVNIQDRNPFTIYTRVKIEESSGTDLRILSNITRYRLDICYKYTNTSGINLIHNSYDSYYNINEHTNTSAPPIQYGEWMDIYYVCRDVNAGPTELYINGEFVRYINHQNYNIYSIINDAKNTMIIGAASENATENNTGVFKMSKFAIYHGIMSEADIKNTSFPQGYSYVANKNDIFDKKPIYVTNIDFSKPYSGEFAINNSTIEYKYGRNVLNRRTKDDKGSSFSQSVFEFKPDRKFYDLQRDDFIITFDVYYKDDGNLVRTPIFGGSLTDQIGFSVDMHYHEKGNISYYISNRLTGRWHSKMGDSRQYTARTSLKPDTWNTVTVSRVKNKSYLFINGVLDSEVIDDYVYGCSYNEYESMYIGRWGGDALRIGSPYALSRFMFVKGIGTEDGNIDFLNTATNGKNIYYFEDNTLKPYDMLTKVEIDTDNLKEVEKMYYNNYGFSVSAAPTDEYNYFIPKGSLDKLNGSFTIHSYPPKTAKPTYTGYGGSDTVLKDANLMVLANTNIEVNTDPEVSASKYEAEIKYESDNKVTYLISNDDENYYGYNGTTWEKDREMTKEEVENLTSVDFGKLLGNEMYKKDFYIKVIVDNKDEMNPLMVNNVDVEFWKNQPPIIEEPEITPDEIHYEFCRVTCIPKDLENEDCELRVLVKKASEEEENTNEFEVVDDWKYVQNGVKALRAYNEKYFLPGLNYIKIQVRDKTGLMSEWTGNLTLTNEAPIMNYTHNDYGIKLQLTDPENDTVSVQISLDDQIILPFTTPIKTPSLFKYEWDRKYLIVGKKHTIKVEIKDYFNKITTETFQIDGQYKGLMFKDHKGKYFTTDDGDILQYLDFKTLIAGQDSDIKSVTLVNQSNYNLKGVYVESNKGNLPDNVNLLLSETLEPFMGKNKIDYPGVFEDRAEKNFFVRISTDTGKGVLKGAFSISSEGGIEKSN